MLLYIFQQLRFKCAGEYTLFLSQFLIFSFLWDSISSLQLMLGFFLPFFALEALSLYKKKVTIYLYREIYILLQELVKWSHRLPESSNAFFSILNLPSHLQKSFKEDKEVGRITHLSSFHCQFQIHFCKAHCKPSWVHRLVCPKF